MGSESSILKYYHVDRKCLAQGQCWTFHKVKHQDGNKLSMFKFSCSLEKLTGIEYWKTIRHPGLVKYYGSGIDRGEVYVITESVQPLQNLLNKLTCHEIISGLYDILEALCFLHEKVKVSCNNISMSTVFVSSDGTWKLGALHCLNSFSKQAQGFIEKLHQVAEKDAILPEDNIKGGIKLDGCSSDARDAYAFGRLLENLLKNINEKDAPGVNKFQTTVISQLISSLPNSRPSLNQLKQDNLFVQNEFLQVKMFLQNFVLQDEKEVLKFSQSLVPLLRQWPEKLVASRLMPLFLARIVILHQEMNKTVLPYLLIPVKDDEPIVFEGAEVRPLFSTSIYVTYVVPLVCKILCVWDIHIRLRILKFFKFFVSLIPKDLLKSLILPQLLLGCKDVNDTLVSASLHALAELVPVLGASVVVGGHREKIFSRGSPKVSGNITNTRIPMNNCHHPPPSPEKNSIAVSKLPLPEESDEVEPCEDKDMISCRKEALNGDATSSVWVDLDDTVLLQALERSSPDGGEELEKVTPDDDQDWPSWDPIEDTPCDLNFVDGIASQPLMSWVAKTETLPKTASDILCSPTKVNGHNTEQSSVQNAASSVSAKTQVLNRQRKISEGLGEEYDIMAIEVKPSRSSEVDFFADMEPAIAKSLKPKPTSLFAVQTPQTQETGWDNDDLEVELGSSG